MKKKVKVLASYKTVLLVVLFCSTTNHSGPPPPFALEELPPARVDLMIPMVVVGILFAVFSIKRNGRSQNKN